MQQLADLSFPRTKRRSLIRSAAFRVQPVLRRWLGSDRTLRLLLNVERLTWRLAYEAVGRRYGEAFYNEVLAVTPEVLAQWVPRGSRVLDLGCGIGRMGRALDGHARYLGVDIDEPVIRQARALPHGDDVHFEVGDVLEPTSGAFDIVLLVHVLEHINDAERLLRSTAGIAPKLIVEVPAFDHFVLNHARRDLGLDFSSDDDHVREYTKPLLQRQLTDAGWTPLDWASSPISVAALAARTEP